MILISWSENEPVITTDLSTKPFYVSKARILEISFKWF